MDFPLVGRTRWLFPLLVTPFVLDGCPTRTGDAVEPGGEEPVLVAIERTETGHQDTGSTTEALRITADGRVRRLFEDGSGASRSETCARLAADALAQLRERVEAVRAGDLQPVYDSSALPGPNANYSVHERIVLGGGDPVDVRIEGWADVPPGVSDLRQWLGAHVADCRAEESSAARPPRESSWGSGCYATDPSDIYRMVRVCLGPPELPEGRFSLVERVAVPDATLSQSFQGVVEDGADGLVLHAETTRSTAVNEQLGTTSDGPESDAHLKWRLEPAADGAATLRAPDGTAVVVRPE